MIAIAGFLKRALLSGSDQDGIQGASVPAGQTVYAIGDIHGRADLLAKLHDKIARHAAEFAQVTAKTIVYLGDYVDRGLDSKRVIDQILESPLSNFQAIHIRGNHEDILLRFLENASLGPDWFAIGGDATLLSYGIVIPQHLPSSERYRVIQQEMKQRIPKSHYDFLCNLSLSYRSGDYFFAHAGVRPGIPIEQQSSRDLMWIRNDFVKSKQDHGSIVVHGHSMTAEPSIQFNRIGIDTCAYATNNLTCLVLQNDTRSFLSTGTA